MDRTTRTAVTPLPMRELLVWNCNGFPNRRAVLRHLQQLTWKPDVIMLEETHSEETPKLSGYSAHASPPSARVTSKGKGREVCISVRKGITFVEHALIGSSAIEHCTVKVITGKKRKESTFMVNVIRHTDRKSFGHSSTRQTGPPETARSWYAGSSTPQTKNGATTERQSRGES